MRRLIIFLAALLLSPGIDYALTSDLLLSVDTSGKISAEVHLQTTLGPAQGANAPFALYVVTLPFRTSETTKVQSPEDVPVAILRRGEGYTLISAAIPGSRTETILRIADAFSLSESPEGKAYLALDLNYPFISQADRQLIGAPFSVLPRKITATLPHDFDEMEIGFGPAQFQRIGKRQYSLDVQTLGVQPTRAWLVFPNPMQDQLQAAKIVLATVIGIFTLLFHVPALKERKLSWSIGVFLISLLVCGLIAYYSRSLAKRMELIEWAAGSAPHVVYGLVSSLYLLFIARKQTLITGRITLDGAPIQIAEVQLWRIANGERQQDQRLETLATEGRYSFRTRAKAPDEKFEVTATARGTDDATSGLFQLERKRIELKAMDLHWRQQTAQAGGGATSAPSATGI